MWTLLALLALGPAEERPAIAPVDLDATVFATCSAVAEPPAYYAISLVPTRQVVGTGRATGLAQMTFDRSPFGVELAADGSYRTTLAVEVAHLPSIDDHEFVAWTTTPSIDRIARIGTLDEDGATTGPVEWNKFLVVITLEPVGYADETSWSGPVILRGMSRSGRMHTMAGHGPFEQLECRTFGY
jgi:hypothetical protein